MKPGILTIAILTCSLSCFCQDFNETFLDTKKVKRIGLQVGLTLPRQIFTSITNPALYPEFNNKARFNAGFFSESGKSDYFVTQIGIFYIGKGYRTNEEILKLDYLRVPLVFNFRSPIISSLFFQAGIGSYLGFAFNGFYKNENILERDILSIPTTNSTKNKPYSFFDGGLVFAASIESTLPNKQILKIGMDYNLGMIKVSNKYKTTTIEGGNAVEIEINNGAKNSVFTIYISYLLDRRKRLTDL